MGFIDGKILRLTFLTAVFLPAFLPVLPMDLSAADDTGASVALSDFALPEYRKKDNRLQFILYGDKATNLGAFINLENPKVDIVNENISNINEVIPLGSVKMYPLNTSAEDVRKFWADKKHCRALISSTAAQYDKNTKVLRGDTPAFFRSREMDIDGVGFDADYENKLIHIRSKVRMVIRPEYRQRGMGGSTTTNQTKTEDQTK